MSYCKVCSKPHSQYVMNNKPVCFHCDELLFDIEIESEEFETPTQEKSPSKERTVALAAKRAKTTSK